MRFPRRTLSTLPEDFRESVSQSMSIFGDEVACLFLYHARQNYGVDSSRLPAGLERFDDALRSSLGNGSLVIVRECSTRIQETFAVRIDPAPESLTQLCRMVVEGCRQEKWIAS